MKFIRTVKEFSRLDILRNEDIRSELKVSPLFEKVEECKTFEEFASKTTVYQRPHIFMLHMVVTMFVRVMFDLKCL